MKRADWRGLEPRRSETAAQKLQERLSGVKFLIPPHAVSQSPHSWTPTRFDDGTEINNVDLATRENSNASRLLLREVRERGGREAWCLLSCPLWSLWVMNLG